MRGAAHDPRDVDEADRGGHNLRRVEQLGQLVQPRVRQRHDADVRLDRGERVVCSQSRGAGEGVEQGRLADVGQPGDSDSQ